MKQEKMCWWCKHCYYNNADGGYSEMTPGYDMSFECKKGYWRYDTFNTTLKQLREYLFKAESCKDFEKVEKIF